MPRHFLGFDGKMEEPPFNDDLFLHESVSSLPFSLHKHLAPKPYLTSFSASKDPLS
uniref:Uncharacterized protein n=1 Tax=Nelumbo nucifera TaxID=4432 RepID=A0A822Z6S7_NELNU|nr:TPA_asm: hypothetical protein HUJ06_013478 [Nelumbo nucifera]